MSTETGNQDLNPLDLMQQLDDASLARFEELVANKQAASRNDLMHLLRKLVEDRPQ